MAGDNNTGKQDLGALARSMGRSRSTGGIRVPPNKGIQSKSQRPRLKAEPKSSESATRNPGNSQGEVSQSEGAIVDIREPAELQRESMRESSNRSVP